MPDPCDRFELVNQIVEEALDLPSPQRHAFAAERCGTDPELLADALRLLSLPGAIDELVDSPQPPTGICPGDLLGGRFRILKELGAGGSGSTFLAEDRFLGPVALKALHPEMRGDASAMESFYREIAAARAVRHRNVCPVFDLFTFDDARGDNLAAFTMKYLSGETLADRLSRGSIPLAEALRIASGLAAGIDALHAEGLVHRDLKPDNIMLVADRHGTLFPVIMDFGLASWSRADGSAIHQAAFSATISGSPAYMAPEQFRTGAVTPAADVYAFGLIVFEMIAGARPFPREDLLPAVIRRATEAPPRLRTAVPGIPHALDGAIARALSIDPAHRQPSAGHVLRDALAEAVPSRPTVRLNMKCRHPFPRSSRLTTAGSKSRAKL